MTAPLGNTFRRVLLAAAALSLASPASAALDDGTRQIMHRVLEAMQHLLPLSLSSRGFDDEQQAETARWIAVLSEATDTLQRHEAPRIESARYLSRSLASDVRTLELAFAEGDQRKTQYYVLALTDHCVACHSRLPAQRKLEVSNDFFTAAERSALDPRARIRLLVATRRFEEALTAWEALFADTTRRPESIEQSGALDDYLSVAIRVQRDLPRAKRSLERFARRSSQPPHLREVLDAWIASLTRLIAEPTPAPSLEAAGKLVGRADAMIEFPADRRGRVYDLVASSLLYRLIAAPPSGFDDPQLGEALYLLGRIEARGPGGRWVSETESHLVSAIRLAPAEPFARDAYSVLEAYIEMDYGGPHGAEIPPQQSALLAELAALIATSDPQPAAPGSES